MNFVQLMCCVFAISICGAEQKDCCKNVCVLEETECATKGSAAHIKAIITGIKGLGLKPMDPLHIEGIEAQNGTKNYKLTNIELKGLKKCSVRNLKINVTNDSYEHYMDCPRLISTLSYGVGNATTCQYTKVDVSVYDYKILNTGYYGAYIKCEDQQPHFFIKSVLSRVDLNDKDQLDIERVADAKHKNKHFDDISKNTGEYLISLIVKKAMRRLFDGLQVYMAAHVLGELLPGSNMPKTCEKHKQ